MQASIRNRLITKPFELLFEMQHAAHDPKVNRRTSMPKTPAARQGVEIKGDTEKVSG